MYLKGLVLRALALTILVLVNTETTYGFSLTDFLDDKLVEKVKPMMKLLPKALPLLQGKVKNEECKEKAKSVAKEATSATDLEPDEVFKLICKLGDECAEEYIEASKSLLEMQMVKTLLKLGPEQKINDFIDLAPTLYSTMCATMVVSEEEEGSADVAEDTESSPEDTESGEEKEEL